MRLVLCLSFLIVTGFIPVNAANSIQIITDSNNANTQCVDNVCYSPATVTFDNNDDLLNMDSFTLQDTSDDGTTEYEFIKMEATARTYDDGSQQVSWHGVNMEGSGIESATLVQLVNGDFGGSLITGTKSYTLVTLPDGSMQVRSFFWKDVPLETEAQSVDLPVQPDKSDNSMNGSDKNNSLDVVASVPSKALESTTLSEGPASDMIEGPTRRRHLDSSTTTVDLIFFVSNAAMCRAASLNAGCDTVDENNWRAMNSELAAFLSVTNNAMQAVGVNVEIRLVGTYFLASSAGDFFPDSNTIDYISQNPTVQQYRNDNGADLVSFIGSPIEVQPGAFICGIGTLLGPWTINGYSSICNGIYTFTHEIGHNFKCLHNREDETLEHPYAHGYQIPGVFRSVMSYQCENSGRATCNAVPYFSSSAHTLSGNPLGDSTHDNARNIKEQAATVAGWRACTINCDSGGGSTGGGGGSVGGGGGIGIGGGSGSGGGGGGGCFSKFNKVEARDKGIITMDQVQIGDYIHIGHGKYSRVYSFSHIDTELEADFLQIHLYHVDLPLELTPDHMVFVSGKPILGSDVKVGDMMGDHVVSQVQVIRRRGVYAPVTYSGSLLVNDVLVSSYVAILDEFSAPVQHFASHIITGLHRMVCNFQFDICMNETYDDGMSNFIHWAIQLVKELNRWRVWLQMAVWLAGIPVLALIYLIQGLSQVHTITVVLLGLLLCLHHVHQTKPKATQ